MEKTNMKAFQVVKDWHDGDHGYGTYESPLFATHELAEQFLAKVWGGDEKLEWGSSHDDLLGDEASPDIVEVDLTPLESLDEIKDFSPDRFSHEIPS